MYKEDHIGSYLIPTRLRKDNSYVLTVLGRNSTINQIYFIFYMRQILKMDIDVGNFYALDLVKRYAKNVYWKAYE